MNCASVGCPPLRAEAYTGERIDAQLDEQTRRWIADPSRNFVKPSEKRVEVSKIFDWYRADFGGPAGKEDERGVLDFLIRHGPAEWKPFLESFDPDDVKHLDYDWSLNDTAG